MLNMLGRYTRWLHTRWPAGVVEKLPVVREDGSTNVAGLFVVGDLTGVPLLKFSSDTGARTVQAIVADRDFQRAREATTEPDIVDLVIVGGGVSGMAAALEARKAGLRFELLEATEPFSTIVNFPKAKPIYTYPTEMTPRGDLQVTALVKEPLLDELRAQTLEQGITPRMARAGKVVRRGKTLEVCLQGGESLLALRVIVAIGRSGNFRKLGVPGEDLDKVANRLHDPKDYCDRDVLIVGGGDSALETAIAIAQCGGRVTLSYRKREFSRPKAGNLDSIHKLAADPDADVQVEEPVSERVTTSAGPFLGAHRKAGSIRMLLGSQVKAIAPEHVVITDVDKRDVTLPNDAVFAMIGREAPLEFFRRSGVRIIGETTPKVWIGLTLFFLFCLLFYNWKSGGVLGDHLSLDGIPALMSSWGESWRSAIADRGTVVGTLAVSMQSPSFWFTLLYTGAIGVFGIRRIRRRRTPYVTLQTSVLFAVQFLPLWLLPTFLLPLAGYNGWFADGLGASISNEFFPLYTSSDSVIPDWGGHPRAYWYAYGLVLAWPLNVYHVFTDHPMAGWLVIAFLQTFVLIPLLVWRFGKGAYCGWICSCGGLAETLGDTLRHKMPHGPKWNRLNMIGQVVLLAATVLLVLRVWGWIFPESWPARSFYALLQGSAFSYKWIVDVTLGGVLGTGLYFKYSGRLWCRFACPLAALMHIYARFSRFRILADKKKCISCNVCTSTCHQGIDVMNFANKGMPMEDPQCVRCSACVQSCPTGVLDFGEVDRKTGAVLKRSWLSASPVRAREAAAATPDG